MEALIGIVLLATLTQFIVDRLKEIIPLDKIGGLALAPVYAAAIGIAVARSAEIDVLAMLGFAASPILGQVLTGIVISGGSTAVHELLAKLRESRAGNLEIIDLAEFIDEDEESKDA